MRYTLYLLVCVCTAAQEPAEILGRIRHNVDAQISRSANYTCVSTIERNYYVISSASQACSSLLVKDRKLSLRDRLRLDVAVSRQAEIFSWHGENNFTSGSVAEVVRGGPISSGGCASGVSAWPASSMGEHESSRSGTRRARARCA